MLRFFRRSSSSRALNVLQADSAPADAVTAGASCTLAHCRAGSQAVVLAVACGDQDACRLRALGLCEGAQVDIVDARHAMLLEVRGTRIAIGRAISAGITVQPTVDAAGPFGPAVPAAS